MAVLPPGSRLGDVTIIRLLAEGGMGRVYEARQDAPTRLVAVKVLREGFGSPAIVRRFRQEADLLAHLRHPHIAQVHAAGTHSGQTGDVPFLIMELVAEATTVTGFARERRLALQDRVEIFAGVAAALAHAHRAGVVHRDLKPANILVDAGGNPKVIDFGVARAFTDADARLTTAAERGELLGTVRYMSPEQLGLDAGEADARSDVYALGLVLHELLLDELPYELGGCSVLEAAALLAGRTGGDAAPLARRLRGRGLAAADATSLAVIVATCLEPRPADRYQSARELAADLDRWRGGQPILARPPTFAQALARLARRHRAAAAATAASLAALLVALGGIGWSWRAADLERRAADMARAAADEARDLAERRRGEAALQAGETRRQLYCSTVLLAAEARDRDNLAEARLLLSEARELASEPGADLIELDLLAASLDESLACLPADGGSVTAVAWSPTGGSLACGTDAGLVKIWRLPPAPTTSRDRLDPVADPVALAAHDRGVWGLAFSPDGRRLASASADGTVRIHDVTTGGEVRRLDAHAAAVYGVAFSPAGDLLATASRDGTVRLWDTGSWEERGRSDAEAGTVFSVAFSADGHALLSTAADGTARIWRLADAAEVLVVSAGTGRIYDASFAADGRSFATAAEDGTARVWDAITGSLLGEFPHPRRVNAVALLPGGLLATGSGDGLLRCWDIASRTEVTRRRGHAAALRAIAPGPRALDVASGSADGTVRIWNLGPAGEPVVPLGAQGLAVACSADGGRLAVGSADGVVRLLDSATLAERRRWTGLSGRVNGLAFSGDGELLVAADDDGLIHRLPLDGPTLEPLAVHRRRAYSVAFSPEGRSLATAGEDRTARVIDPLSGVDRVPPLKHPARVFSAAFHPDGRRLATACEDRMVRLWDAASGLELAAWPGPTRPVNWVCFAPDGSRLAAACSDGTVRTWNVSDGSVVAVLGGPAGQVWKVAWSGPGNRIAAASADGAVHLWDSATGQRMTTLRGHANEVWGLAFLPGRNALATASWDGTLRLWGAPPSGAAAPSGGAAAGRHWDQFRGPSADGRAPGTTLPAAWSEQEGVRWKTPIPGKAWASPVVADGRIWLANATEDGRRLSAVCVDAETGRILHDVTVFEPAEPAFCHPYNSHASPTPVLAAGKLFVHFGSAGTACLDAASGEVLWRRQDLPCDHHRGPGSSPIPWRDRLFVNFDGFDRQYVVALDQATGRTLWQTDRDIEYGSDDGDMKKAYGTPTVIEHQGRLELVSPAAVATVAYDPETGQELWRVYHGGYNAAARPLFADGLVIVTTAGGDNVVAIRPGGTGDVTKTHVAWKFKKSAPTRPSQAIVGDHLYLASDTGVFSCVELATGRIAWQERRSGRHSASPVESGGRLWWCDEDGTTVVTNANPERFELLAENKLEAGCMASPAVIGDDLVIRTKTHLYRIGAAKP